jgi:hypothetical protein
MSPLVVALLLVLAALLFYRWVERRHKILFAKLLAALLLLGAAIVGVLVWVDARRQADDRERLASVSISLVPSRPDTATIPEPKEFDVPDSTLTLRLCNTGQRTVESVRFRPTTYLERRSTPYPVSIPKASPGYFDTFLRSDYLLAPGACDTVTWRGHFQLYDSVAFEITTVELSGHR